MEIPKDKKEVERILGMITYASKFIPKLSQLTKPLKQLIRKNAAFEWNINHTLVYNKLKDFLSTTPVLQYYNSKKAVTVSVDASQNVLVLFEFKPIYLSCMPQEL